MSVKIERCYALITLIYSSFDDAMPTVVISALSCRPSSSSSSSNNNNDNNNNNNNNNNNKEAENILKYKDLTIEIQCMWNVKTRVIPVILGATGTISKSFRK